MTEKVWTGYSWVRKFDIGKYIQIKYEHVIPSAESAKILTIKLTFPIIKKG